LPPKLPIRVIFDSSFLFIPTQFHIHIFEELAELLNRRYEPILLSPTYEELQRIAESGSVKLRQQAKLALEFAQACHLVEVEKKAEESHDDVIVRVASTTPVCVATNDRTLKKRLKRIDVPVIYMRQKSHLAIDGAI
jgi:rRNA-processing protein FCF1